MEIFNTNGGNGNKVLNTDDSDDETYTVSESMRIDGSGNVGIGVDGPTNDWTFLVK